MKQCPICRTLPEHCHMCGGQLKTVLDGQKQCNSCHRLQRSIWHGWAPEPITRRANGPHPAPIHGKGATP